MILVTKLCEDSGWSLHSLKEEAFICTWSFRFRGMIMSIKKQRFPIKLNNATRNSLVPNEFYLPEINTFLNVDTCRYCVIDPICQIVHPFTWHTRSQDETDQIKKEVILLGMHWCMKLQDVHLSTCHYSIIINQKFTKRVILDNFQE